MDVVTKKEAAVIDEAQQEADKLKRRLDQSAAPIEKNVFTGMGKKEQAEFLSAGLSKDHKTFWDLIKSANHYYEELKGSMDEKDTTHEFITARALALQEITNPNLKETLMAACTEPDREESLWELAYEGHFYGRVNGRKYGNFWPRVFNGPSLRILDHINDIDETAFSNFSKNYTKARRNPTDLKRLGWAIHYLQDLTAPHHVGNMAIFFEMITDDNNTHYAFEKFARNFVYDNKEAFDVAARAHYERLKAVFDPQKPKQLARTVFNDAVTNIPKVKGDDLKRWESAVRDAIPLAIAATAVIMEPWK